MAGPQEQDNGAHGGAYATVRPWLPAVAVAVPFGMAIVTPALMPAVPLECLVPAPLAMPPLVPPMITVILDGLDARHAERNRDIARRGTDAG